VQVKPSSHHSYKRDSKQYISVPNLFTTMSLFCGFLAVSLVMSGRFVVAAWIIFMAGIFDALDGRIARASGKVSDFGLQLDSLSDVVSSGLAPSILVYEYYLKGIGGHPAVGLLLSFLPLLFSTIRLARYNVLALNEGHKPDYVGLPAPAAATILASLVVLHSHINSAILLRLMIVMTPLVSLAMVSHLHYEGIPRFSIKGGLVNSIKLFMMLIALICVFIWPELTYCTFMLTYFASGPIKFLMQLISGAEESIDASGLDESIVLEPPAEEPAV
jgi:CDP-diacylglycerol---serine O-phosphatidyltransferase